MTRNALIRVVGLALWALAAAACATNPPPIATPEPPPAPSLERPANVSVVTAAGAPIAKLTAALRFDNAPASVNSAGDGRLSFALTAVHPPCEGGWLTVAAPGYVEQHVRVLAPLTADEYAWGDGCPDPEKPDTLLRPADAVLTLQPAVRAVERLQMDGRRGFINPAGQLVPATSVTGFRLVELVATGRSAEAAAFLEATKAARFVRVLVMAFHLFKLTPAEGLAALPATLDLLEAHGRYAEVVLFADTRSYPGLDYRQSARIAADICEQHKACAAIEIGNELHSLHATQDEALGDVEFLKELRRIVRARSNVAVSLGSTHAEDDESDIFREGDYLTIHGSRAGGDGAVGIDWRSLRHTNEQRALADRVNKWAWNDEPDRSQLRCDWQLGMGLLTRMFSLGDTFHFFGGLQAKSPNRVRGTVSAIGRVVGIGRTDFHAVSGLPPAGPETTALQCRARGWALIPDDWIGQYSNASFAGGPVKSATGAVRVYSSIRGNQAYTLVLGASSPSMVPDWADGWSQHTQVLNEEGVQLWRVAR